MSTLHEVKRAVRSLSPGERTELLDWMAVNLNVGLFVNEPPMTYGAVALEHDFYTIEQYLELEDGTTLAFEYVAGQIYAMADPSGSHGTIVENLYSQLLMHLRGQPCRVRLASNRVLFKCRGDDIVYRPDVWVGCAERRNEKGELVEEPRLVMEVLSPSTARIDTREKAINYREIPSLDEIVLVAQKVAQVTIYRRAEAWQRTVLGSPEDVLELRSIGLSLPVAEIYEGAAR